MLWTSNTTPGDVHGDWTRVVDTTAAGGAALQNPNRGAAKITPALANPASYFEIQFNANAGVDYHLWVRLRAQNDSFANDSVHVQFSDSVDAAGAAAARIGTTASAEVVLQDGTAGAALSAWGWSDNGWDTPGTPIRFANSGSHVVRIQQREDGASVDQIVLSPDIYASDPPGVRRKDTTILARTDGSSPAPPSAAGTLVLWTSQIADSSIFGNWLLTTDTTAAGGAALRNPDAGLAKVSPALAHPVNYFETTFTATAGIPYHVWLRMRADANSTSNDSVHAQFNDSVTSSGAATARIGTTSSAEFVLQGGRHAAAPHGWGWADSGWGALGLQTYFAKSGSHTIRIQQREDGATIDQIVISPDAYLAVSPGVRRDDSTILAATGGSSSNQPPTATLSSPGDGQTFSAPATITISASASDPENRLARVEFYSGSTLLGSASTAPYSITWSSVAAGSYTLTAVAIDADGGRGTSAAVHVTVGAANKPPTVSLTSPSNGAAFTAPGTITLTATASDPEGQLTRVSFYSGTTLLGSDTTTPYSFSWSSVPAGTYSLTALAVDAAGNQTTSTAVTVTVGTAPPPTFMVTFTASTDDSTDVTSYRLDVYKNGANPATATPVASSDLGKPTLGANQLIQVDRTTFLSALAAGTYVVTVTAVGPGGQTASAPYTFTR